MLTTCGEDRNMSQISISSYAKEIVINVNQPRHSIPEHV